MTAFLSNEFLADVLHNLPRVFLLGAPILFAVITLAALLDARLPAKIERDSGT